jgi:hypothetical protein
MGQHHERAAVLADVVSRIVAATPVPTGQPK